MYKFRSHFICSAIFVLFVAIPVNGQQTDVTQSGNPQTVDDSKKKPEASSSATDTSGEKDSESTKRSNRLASESSPYLLQHAMNPVDWYPWGQEAFDKAERENKLVFLSVGYAACHWCHVMERESFEDDEIAKILNERFVCVKVDREERPDVDQIYMTAVQLVTGSGGWPMSVFVLPDGKPFWGGTYFPARDGDRGSATGFLTVLSQIDLAWKEQNEQVRAQAQAVTEAIRAQQVSSENGTDAKVYDREMIQQTLRSLQDQYDPIYGGFASGPNQPKFPEPSNLRFLMALAMSEKSKDGGSNRENSPKADASTQQRVSAEEMLRGTLDGMIRGGMYDHLAGGFHRYSVDSRWQIPHFEKMLYDNAQLASIFAQAALMFDNEEYRWIAEGVCDFLLEEMRSPEGGFYSSIDADSEGEEGKYYRWDREELREFESMESFAEFSKIYQLDGEPNFENEYYVLAPRQNLQSLAQAREQSIEAMLSPLKPITSQMLKRRGERIAPITDTKILTAWNGLVIASLADTGRLLGKKEYIRAAVECLEFLLEKSRGSDARLLRSYARGEAKLKGYLNDYAFLIAGILAVHRATADQRLITMASRLMDEQIQWFWDETEGGFFFTASDHPESIVRLKNPVDSAVPSGISVSAENLLELIRQGGDVDTEEGKLSYSERLASTLRSVMPLVSRAPSAATRMGAVAIELQGDGHQGEALK